MPYLDITDGRLYFETAGSGEAVVFVHGLGGSTRQWDPQFESLPETYRVVRYDLRGHARSTVPTPAPYSYAGDLCALLDHLGIERASLVGQSMGGEIAIEFALAYPERLNRLVLVDTAVNGYEWSDQWGPSWAPIAEAIASGEHGAFIPILLEHPLLVHSAKNPAVKAELTEIFQDYSGWHFLNSDPRVFAEPPATQQLGRIETPTLIILGLEDAPDFHRIADILMEGLPNAQRIDLPGVGHIAPLEIPDEFNRIVRQFLNRESNKTVRAQVEI